MDPETGQRRPVLKVDGKPFKLDDRPAMAWIYDQVPSTREEAFRMTLTVMKCAQVGFTVLEMLVAIYFALKFDPIKIGMFLPDMNLARGKSAERFMPIVRCVPDAYARLTDEATNSKERAKGEGNVMIRRMAGSLFHFLWTSGKATTESYPMDVVSFDEVQEMKIADMEKARERLSASEFKFTLMGSTANWPEADIHHWYLQGSQHRFHTLCKTCGVAEPLDDYFPECIGFDPTCPDRVTGLPGDYRYRCRAGHWIDDPQVGEWRAMDPEAILHKHISVHFHQMLSPTVSPREMIEAWRNATDKKNFFNRKLGKPYQDPSQIPVNLEHLHRCEAMGKEAGILWKKRARGTFMGIDQMGGFNVVWIKERLESGRQALIHVEEVYDDDPFARCSELMDLYGVQVCCVELLPNYNDAKRFAGRHPGRVFLASYGVVQDDMLRWGDGPTLGTSERRTDEEERDRYTVTLDQYKCMSVSLARIVNAQCLFPESDGLVQEILERGVRERRAILRDIGFKHLQKVALVTERKADDQRELKRFVKKVGIDPHHAYANMLCDVAWARQHNTATFIFPDAVGAGDLGGATGLPVDVTSLMQPLPPGQVCGRCIECPMGPQGPPRKFFCKVFNAETEARSKGCANFVDGNR